MPKRSNGWISAYLAQARGRAGVYLAFQRGSGGERLFSKLEERKDEIKAALGVPAEWTTTSDGVHRAIVTKEFPGKLLLIRVPNRKTGLLT